MTERGTSGGMEITSTALLGETLKKARKLGRRIERLREEQDSLLTPVVAKAMRGGYESAADLLNLLPPGFHRCELRTWVNMNTPNNRIS